MMRWTVNGLMKDLHFVLLSLNVSRWISEDWEHCTKTCGSLGFQIRTVRCVQFLHDSTNRSIHSKYCSGEKPESRRPCNRVPCPAQWRTGAWSEVRHPINSLCFSSAWFQITLIGCHFLSTRLSILVTRTMCETEHKAPLTFSADQCHIASENPPIPFSHDNK